MPDSHKESRDKIDRATDQDRKKSRDDHRKEPPESERETRDRVDRETDHDRRD